MGLERWDMGGMGGIRGLYGPGEEEGAEKQGKEGGGGGVEVHLGRMSPGLRLAAVLK
jgi:hypothetical protein